MRWLTSILIGVLLLAGTSEAQILEPIVLEAEVERAALLSAWTLATMKHTAIESVHPVAHAVRKVALEIERDPEVRGSGERKLNDRHFNIVVRAEEELLRIKVSEKENDEYRLALAYDALAQLPSIRWIQVKLSPTFYGEERLPERGEEKSSGGLVGKVIKFDLQFQIGGVTRQATDTYPEERRATIARLESEVRLTVTSEAAAEEMKRSHMSYHTLRGASAMLFARKLEMTSVKKVLQWGNFLQMAKNVVTPKPFSAKRGDVFSHEYLAEYDEKKKQTEITARMMHFRMVEGEWKIICHNEASEVKDGLVLITSLDEGFTTKSHVVNPDVPR